MAKKMLTSKQQRFAEEYLIDLNATQAGIRAGYSPNSARQQGQRLLSNAAMSLAIQEGMKKREERTEITQDRVLQEMALIGFSDMGDFMRISEHGPILDLTDLPIGATRIISEIVQVEYMEGNGEDAERVKKTRLKFHSKLQALDLMGKHLGMFGSNAALVDVNVGPVFVYAPDTSNITAEEWFEQSKPKLDG